MLARLAIAALLLASVPARASHDGEDEVLTASDGRGNIVTAYNQFDGREHSIWVTRMTSNGYQVWSYQHSDGYFEKAYASAMDKDGNFFLAGLRNYNQQRNFLLMKYNENGYLAWEYADDRSQCTATSIAVDNQGSVAAAGVCRSGNSYPARIVKYSNDGARQWYQEYDQGGRNYVRGLQVDYAGNLSMSVEIVSGDGQDGSYTRRTVTYTPDGRFLEAR